MSNPVIIDGSEVEVGKQMYDLIEGVGTVINVTADSIYVEFANQRKNRYTLNGVLARIKRLYWRNPIFVIPSDDDVAWDRTKLLVLDLVNAVKNNWH